MSWLVFWLVVYLVLLVIITVGHLKKTDTESYLINNRQTRTLPLVFSTISTFVGGGTSIGLITMGYESGFTALGIGIAYVLGFMILATFARKINQLGFIQSIYSLPGFLISSYTRPTEGRFLRIFSLTVSGINIFIFFFLLSAQFVAMASLLKFAFGLGYESAAVISCLVVIFYTALAGLSGVILTDMVQFVFIMILLVVVFIPGILSDTSGFTRLRELPETMLHGTAYGISFLIGTLLFITPSVMVRMDIWQRILAARDGKIAVRMSLISGLGMIPFYLIFPLAGMAVRLTVGNELPSTEATGYFLKSHAGDFIFGLAIIGLLSALMSSSDSFLNVISISAVKDIQGFISQKVILSLPVKTMVQWVSGLFGLLAMVVSLLFPELVDLMVIGIGTISIFVPITLLALRIQGVYALRNWALASIILGFLVNVSLFILSLHKPGIIETKSSFIPAFIVSFIVLLLGYIIKRKEL